MRFSIRVRLTLWYVALIAASLAVVAIGGYSFLATVTLDDVDDLLARTASTVATAMEFERNAGAPDSVAMRSVAEGLKLPDVAVLVLDGSTRKVQAAEGHPQRPVALTEDQRRDLTDTMSAFAVRTAQRPLLESVHVAGMDARLFTLPYVLGTRPLVITTARSLGARDAMLEESRTALGIGIPVLLALAAIGGYWLAGKSLSPVAAMSAQARAIGGGNLHERLPVRNPDDELGQLAGVLNDLLARIEAAFDAQRRLVAEASHELRTPVAVISGESEHALSRPDRPGSELRDALQVIHAESQRLRAAIDDLFFLARADAGERSVKREPVNLAELALACVRAAQSRAPNRTITVQPDRGPDVTVTGDGELLRRVLDNLVTNAITHSTPGGPVTVRLSATEGFARIDVEDGGPGIPPAQRERIFERFYRGENARSVAEGTGAGLGLAIVRWVALAHGGDVMVGESPGGGCRFRVSIPLDDRPMAT